jgi:hypothetical protein
MFPYQPFILALLEALFFILLLYLDLLVIKMVILRLFAVLELGTMYLHLYTAAWPCTDSSSSTADTLPTGTCSDSDSGSDWVPAGMSGRVVILSAAVVAAVAVAVVAVPVPVVVAVVVPVVMAVLVLSTLRLDMLTLGVNSLGNTLPAAAAVAELGDGGCNIHEHSRLWCICDPAQLELGSDAFVQKKHVRSKILMKGAVPPQPSGQSSELPK